MVHLKRSTKCTSSPIISHHWLLHRWCVPLQLASHWLTATGLICILYWLIVAPAARAFWQKLQWKKKYHHLCSFLFSFLVLYNIKAWIFYPSSEHQLLYQIRIDSLWWKVIFNLFTRKKIIFFLNYHFLIETSLLFHLFSIVFSLMLYQLGSTKTMRWKG